MMDKIGDKYVDKKTLVYAMFCIGMLIAFFGSLRPWFMWPLSKYYSFMAAIPFLISIILSNSSKSPLFHRKSFFVPTSICTIVLVYQAFVNGLNFFGYLNVFAQVLCFATLFAFDLDMLRKALRLLCKIMACMMLVSFPLFVLYVVGFSLPHSSLMTETQSYSFDNYYFFLIDDRSLMAIFPRFQSVFTEPGHLGTATSFLLFTQLGNWRKWYNVILIGATLFSFSLAAYVFLSLIALLSSWVLRKHFFLKLSLVIIVLVSIVVGAFFYNDGDNLVNTLIIERLAFEDGKMVGDNRVTEDFEADFDSFMNTDDIYFGRDFDAEDYGFGNTGYRVFIYDYGLIGLFFVILLYLDIFFEAESKRAAFAMLIVVLAAFVVRATPISYYFLFAFYNVANMSLKDKSRPILTS